MCNHLKLTAAVFSIWVNEPSVSYTESNMLHCDVSTVA